MKKTAIAALITMILFLGGCKKEITKPTVSFKAYTLDSNGKIIKEIHQGDTLNVAPGQNVYFRYNGSSDTKVAIWPGDRSVIPTDSSSYDYDAYNGSGFNVRKYHGFPLPQSTDPFVYMYKIPGIFKAYVVGTNVGNSGSDVASSYQFITVNVVDSEFSFTSFKTFYVINLGKNVNADTAIFTDNNITMHVPGSSRVASGIATFDVMVGSVVTVNGKIQISGLTINDFSEPVKYTITSPDGVSESYFVSLIKYPKKTEALVTSYELPALNAKATIDQDAGTIKLVVPYMADTSISYRTVFTSSELSTLKRKSQVISSNQTSLKYNNPLTLQIYAEDVAYTKSYALTTVYSTGVGSASIPGLNPPAIVSIDYKNFALSFSVLKGTNIAATALNITTYPLNANIKVLEEKGEASDKDFINGVTLLNLTQPAKIKISDPALGYVIYTITANVLQ